MIVTATELDGGYIVDLNRMVDERGFFARAWCRDEFEKHGLSSESRQINLSYNRRKGTVRGLHYQREPDAEVKLIRCVRGAIYDVIADLRTESPTYGAWFGLELTAENRRALYVPRGCAHGFQALQDDTEVIYQVSASYAPASEGGVRYDDPFFGIEWPMAVTEISEKDTSWPDYIPAQPDALRGRDATEGTGQ